MRGGALYPPTHDDINIYNYMYILKIIIYIYIIACVHVTKTTVVAQCCSFFIVLMECIYVQYFHTHIYIPRTVCMMSDCVLLVVI